MNNEKASEARRTTWTGQRPKLAAFWRAIIEIGFIIFLFYSNLLMGEFVKSRDGHVTLVNAILDLCTIKTFEIGLVCALIGFVVVESLRQKI